MTKHPNTKEEVTECVRRLGQNIIDNAEDYAGELKITRRLQFVLTVEMDAVPEIENTRSNIVPVLIHE